VLRTCHHSGDQQHDVWTVIGQQTVGLVAAVLCCAHANDGSLCQLALHRKCSICTTCLHCTGLKFEPVQKGQAKYLCPHSKVFVSICLTGYCHHEAVSNQPLFRLALICSFNALKHKHNFICHQNYQLEIPRSAHTVCLCVLCGSENKQRLFPYTALTDWFV